MRLVGVNQCKNGGRASTHNKSNNTQIGMLILCFLYFFVELMITMYKSKFV